MKITHSLTFFCCLLGLNSFTSQCPRKEKEIHEDRLQHALHCLRNQDLTRYANPEVKRYLEIMQAGIAEEKRIKKEIKEQQLHSTNIEKSNPLS